MDFVYAWPCGGDYSMADKLVCWTKIGKLPEFINYYVQARTYASLSRSITLSQRIHLTENRFSLSAPMLARPISNIEIIDIHGVPRGWCEKKKKREQINTRENSWKCVASWLAALVGIERYISNISSVFGRLIFDGRHTQFGECNLKSKIFATVLHESAFQHPPIAVAVNHSYWMRSRHSQFQMWSSKKSFRNECMLYGLRTGAGGHSARTTHMMRLSVIPSICSCRINFLH